MSKTEKTEIKKVYISGPISGKDYQEVLVAFHKGEKAMRNIGLRTVNPTTWWGHWHWIFEKLPYGLQLFICMCYLHGCQEILFLPGWTESRGAKLEKAFADFWDIKRHVMKRHQKGNKILMQRCVPEAPALPDAMKAVAKLGKEFSKLSVSMDDLKSCQDEKPDQKRKKRKKRKHRPASDNINEISINTTK